MILPRAADIASEAGQLVARQYGYYGRNCYYRNCNSAWYRWGRWVLAGVLIFIGLLVLAFFLFCASRRRRRSRKFAGNSTPMNTTNTGYYQQQQQYQPPAGAPPQYGYGGEAQGYYGQQNGVTQPPNTYQK